MELKKYIKKKILNLLIKIVPELKHIVRKDLSWHRISSIEVNCEKGNHTKIYPNYRIYNSKIGDYTYIAENSIISFTEIGRFCSIGPNLLCGWGIHPTNGLSTSPMFYSTLKQNGVTLSDSNKIEERKKIKIGNDVFIGANVTILDGVTIGDGAIIGAGAVVSKDIPDFAIAVGCPIQIKKYRFTEKQRLELKKISWWNFSKDKLKDVEKYFFEIDKFIDKYK